MNVLCTVHIGIALCFPNLNSPPPTDDCGWAQEEYYWAGEEATLIGQEPKPDYDLMARFLDKASKDMHTACDVQLPPDTPGIGVQPLHVFGLMPNQGNG